MLEWIKEIGLLGFWFFLAKGLLWLLLFALVAFGIVDKSKVQRLKNTFRLFKRRGK